MNSTEKPNEPPSETLISVIGSDLVPLAKEYGEIMIDGVLNEGTLNDAPIISTITGLGKAAHSVKAHLASKKLINFLIQLKDIPEDRRIKKLEELFVL